MIERGLATFLEVGSALLTIRESRLYRGTHSTFEDYCQERWGMSRCHANRQIQAAEVVGSLGPIGPKPANEAQARELARVADLDTRRSIWAVLTENGAQPTAAQIRAEVDFFVVLEARNALVTRAADLVRQANDAMPENNDDRGGEAGQRGGRSGPGCRGRS